ncbi:MED26 family protein [Megaselia abdita]
MTKPLQVQKKDLLARILSLSDDFYLENKFPVLRYPFDETTTIFMAHELSPLPKLIKLSEDIAVESAPAPASSTDTDDSDTGSDTDISEDNNLSDGSSEETETSSNMDFYSNEDVVTNSVNVPEPNISTDPENFQSDNFREWYETLQVRSYNDELLTILPYVIFD